MKKSKKKAPAKAAGKKKAAKKPMKAKSKLLAKPKKKSKLIAKSKGKPKAKSKGLSVVELFEMKKQQQEQKGSADPHTHEAPPHELHDKAKLQAKPKGNTKMERGPGPGNRHH